MGMAQEKLPSAVSEIEGYIFLFRGQKVMLSHDLSELYGVESRVLVQAVKRNSDRFPGDFMFQLAWKEVDRARSRPSDRTPSPNSRSQTVILRWGGNVKYRPYAFTEQGGAAATANTFPMFSRNMARSCWLAS